MIIEMAELKVRLLSDWQPGSPVIWSTDGIVWGAMRYRCGSSEPQLQAAEAWFIENPWAPQEDEEFGPWRIQ